MLSHTTIVVIIIVVFLTKNQGFGGVSLLVLEQVEQRFLVAQSDRSAPYILHYTCLMHLVYDVLRDHSSCPELPSHLTELVVGLGLVLRHEDPILLQDNEGLLAEQAVEWRVDVRSEKATTEIISIN